MGIRSRGRGLDDGGGPDGLRSIDQTVWMISPLIRELKATLDRLVETPQFVDEWTADQAKVFAKAAANFKRSSLDVLAAATPFLRMYYEASRGQIAAGAPPIPVDADIWKHVAFVHGPEFGIGGTRLEPGRSYISFEGEVTWEPEHGLQLVFEHGLRVCKVGPYDGHFTNAHAYGDESLLGTVFR